MFDPYPRPIFLLGLFWGPLSNPFSGNCFRPSIQAWPAYQLQRQPLRFHVQALTLRPLHLRPTCMTCLAPLHQLLCTLPVLFFSFTSPTSLLPFFFSFFPHEHLLPRKLLCWPSFTSPFVPSPCLHLPHVCLCSKQVVTNSSSLHTLEGALSAVALHVTATPTPAPSNSSPCCHASPSHA